MALILSLKLSYKTIFDNTQFIHHKQVLLLQLLNITSYSFSPANNLLTAFSVLKYINHTNIFLLLVINQSYENTQVLNFKRFLSISELEVEDSLVYIIYKTISCGQDIFVNPDLR